MELDQVIKRLDWLDDERRKDKMLIASMNERISRYEEENTDMNSRIAELSSEIVRLSAIITSYDNIENLVNEFRVDFNRSIEGIEKKRLDRERELEKIRLDELVPISQSIYDLKKGLDGIPELKRGMQLRVEEEFRLGTLIEELEKRVTKSSRFEEDSLLNQKVIEDGRRQDAKRVTDLQGELATLRKRVDELRGKSDLVMDSSRKLDVKMAELDESNKDIRKVQAILQEKQNLFMVELDRDWKEWKNKLEEMSKQSIDIESQIVNLDNTHRTVKRAREQFEEVIQRVERRANEITEMQRLMEERFRQDWITFKADDQKRWASYSIAQEEKYRETDRQVEKHADQITNLREFSQEMSDSIQQEAEEALINIAQLQNIINALNEQAERRTKR